MLGWWVANFVFPDHLLYGFADAASIHMNISGAIATVCSADMCVVYSQRWVRAVTI
jgi:hypothetical protein